MRRAELDGVLAYGHYGRPLLVFPAQEGNRFEWEDRGMVAAIADLIEAGRVKLYCVDSFDAGRHRAARRLDWSRGRDADDARIGRKNRPLRGRQ